MGKVGLQRQLAAGEIGGVEIAEHDRGVGDGRLGAAAAIAGGAGLGAGRARADAQATRAVDPGDAAAAGAQRHDVEHRHAHAVLADRGVGADSDGAALCQRDVASRCRRCRSR